MNEGLAEGDDEQRKRFEQALAALSPEFREVFLLYTREQQSCEVIAQRLGLTVPTVKARLHRARYRLQERA
jgi:RNA polymerase sigma factor (sigma-70 family)